MWVAGFLNRKFGADQVNKYIRWLEFDGTHCIVAKCTEQNFGIIKIS